MRYFSALCARMYRFSANSRATISSTAIFLSQQSRQYFSSPRGSDTSFAPHSAHRDWATDLRGIAVHCIKFATPQVPTPNHPREPAATRTVERRNRKGHISTMPVDRASGAVDVVDVLPSRALARAHRGGVHRVHVLFHHPPRAEARRDAGDRVADDAQPAVRDPVLAL